MTVAKASARKCRHYQTGAVAYKALVKFSTVNRHGDTEVSSRVIGQTGRRGEQGRTFENKADAIASADRYIVTERARLHAQAVKMTRACGSATGHRYLQAQFEMYGGTGDAFEPTP